MRPSDVDGLDPESSASGDDPVLTHAVKLLQSSAPYRVVGDPSLSALKAVSEAIDVVRWASIHHAAAHRDADLTASWQLLWNVVPFLRVNRISTRFMSLLLSDLLTVQQGGTPSRLLRPRKVTGRRPRACPTRPRARLSGCRHGARSGLRPDPRRGMSMGVRARARADRAIDTGGAEHDRPLACQVRRERGRGGRAGTRGVPSDPRSALAREARS